MTEDDADREQGVDFTAIDSILDELEYPITTDDLLAEHGDRTIERTNAEPITIRELFEDAGDETFESAEAVRQSVLNLMPEASVGREGYSDRGGAIPDEHVDDDGQFEDESL